MFLGKIEDKQVKLPRNSAKVELPRYVGGTSTFIYLGSYHLELSKRINSFSPWKAQGFEKRFAMSRILTVSISAKSWMKKVCLHPSLAHQGRRLIAKAEQEQVIKQLQKQNNQGNAKYSVTVSLAIAYEKPH